jgi:hypothetical protein
VSKRSKSKKSQEGSTVVSPRSNQENLFEGNAGGFDMNVGDFELK